MTISGRHATTQLWGGKSPYPPYQRLAFGPPVRVNNVQDIEAAAAAPPLLTAFDDSEGEESDQGEELIFSAFSPGERQHLANQMGL